MAAKGASIKTYLAVFVALLAMTALTIWIAFIDLGFLNNVVAMGIAVFKATLVGLFFMHVRYSSRLIAIYAMAGALWLGILIVLTMSEVMARGWLPIPGR